MAVTAKFINGLKEIGGTFVEIETGAAKCVFDFGYAKGGLLDRDIPLRPEFAASDLASFGVLPRTDGVYDESNAKILRRNFNSPPARIIRASSTAHKARYAEADP